MRSIIDDRRTIYIHPNATVNDLPTTGTPEIPAVSDADPFVPDHMDDPKIYPGDVLVGVTGDNVEFIELVVDKQDDHVIVVPLTQGTPAAVPDNIFSARIFQADEVHIFEGIGEEIGEVDVEPDASTLERPEAAKPR